MSKCMYMHEEALRNLVFLILTMAMWSLYIIFMLYTILLGFVTCAAALQEETGHLVSGM